MMAEHPLTQYLEPLILDANDKEEVISKAVDNLTSGRVHVIGFSGKKASGKDTLAHNFIEKFTLDGGQADFASIGAQIKGEATEMFTIFYQWILRERELYSENLKSGRLPLNVTLRNDLAAELHNRSEARFVDFCRKFNVTRKNADFLYSTVYTLLKNNPNINGYNRENEVITVLQYLGTDVRQPQDSIYWTRKMLWDVARNSAAGFNSLTNDVRYPHDADSLRDIGAFLVRLEVSEETQIERLKIRDNVVPSEEVLHHKSEVALDNYGAFDVVVDTDGRDPRDTFGIALKAFQNRL